MPARTHEDDLHQILSSEGAAWTLWCRSAAGCAFVNVDGRIIAANPKLAATLGYAESELAGKHFRDITAAPDAVHDEEQFRRLMAGEIDSYQMVKTYVTKYRQRITARLTVTRFGDRAEVVWSQVQPIDTLSIDSLTEEDEERVTAMLLGRLIWQNKRGVIVGLLALGGIFKLDQLLAIVFGR